MGWVPAKTSVSCTTTTSRRIQPVRANPCVAPVAAKLVTALSWNEPSPPLSLRKASSRMPFASSPMSCHPMARLQWVPSAAQHLP